MPGARARTRIEAQPIRQHGGLPMKDEPLHQRILPEKHYVDVAYAACWWWVSAGVNEGRPRAVVGHVL